MACPHRTCLHIVWMLFAFVVLTNARDDKRNTVMKVPPSLTYHECIHDQIATSFDELPRSDVFSGGGLRAIPSELNASKRNYIRFHEFFLFEDACTSVKNAVPTLRGDTLLKCTSDDILTAQKARVLKALMNNALKFLSKMLLVDSMEVMDVPANACSYVRSPPLSLKNVDYVVVITANPTESNTSTVAWARPCHVETRTRRPIVGHINFVPNAIKNYYSKADKYVALHELTHALGFTDIAAQVKEYKDADGIRREGSARVYRENLGKHVTIIKTPRVLNVARKHFGCPTLDGVEIEDAGGPGTAGSHWKKRILYQEVLVGVVTSAMLYYSSFTLAFLEDLGYYSIDYSFAEDNLLWGRNKSCQFVYNRCNDQSDEVTEYCFEEGEYLDWGRCTHDRMGIGACDVVQYEGDLPHVFQYLPKKSSGGGLAVMDYCPSVTVFSNKNCISEQQFDMMNLYGHEFTPNSRCFESNMITGAFPNAFYGARCFPMTCTVNGQILIRVQGQTAPCPANGEAGYADTSRLKGIYGSIQCPDSKALCLDIDGSGLSIIPDTVATAQKMPSSVNHSPLNFSINYSASCAERVECAEKLNLSYPTCRLAAHKILGCFGTDCRLERKRWLRNGQWPKKCEDRKTLAEECLDGWMGANEICAVASASLRMTTIIPMVIVSIFLGVSMFVP